MELVAHGEAHQFMPGGMERDLVDAPAPAVMGAQFRQVAVGLPRQILNRLRADMAADRARLLAEPAGVEGV